MGPPLEVSLARMRVDGDVAGLRRAVETGDLYTSGSAVALLGDIGGEAAVEFLLDLLERWDAEHPYVHMWAAEALGRLRERRAVPGLLRLLEGGELANQGQEEIVLRALADIGGPEVVRVLLDRLEGNGASLWMAVDALTRLRAPETVPALLAALWRLLPMNGVRAVRALSALRDARAGPALLFLVDSKGSSPALRRAALEALAALPDEVWPLPGGSAVLLKRGLRDQDPETSRLAAELMTRIDAGREKLRQVLDDYMRPEPLMTVPDTGVARICAMVRERPELIGETNDDRNFRTLDRLLSEAPTPLVRRAAAEAMAAVGHEDAGGALLAALDDERITDAVAASLARLPSPPIQRLLTLLAKGTRPTQRRGAAMALGLAGCEAAAPLLLAALGEEGPLGPRIAAVDALGALCHRPATAQLASLASDAEEAGTIRARALRALGLIGAPESLPAVLGGAREANEAVRIRAAEALGAFPVPEAAEALRALVTTDASRDVARAAVRALGSIGAPAASVLSSLAERLRVDVASELVTALAACPGTETGTALARLATSTAPEEVRTAAAEALSERRSPENVAPLAAMTQTHRRDECHTAALRGLAAISTKEAIEHVLAYYERSVNLGPQDQDVLDTIAARSRTDTAAQDPPH
jgi:HEAT repeat protein